MNRDTRTLNVNRSTSTGHRLTHYEGACGNIHGHNMEWEIEAIVEMDEDDPSNMPIDLKDVAEVVDSVDHATVLGEEDEIVKRLIHSFDSVRVKSQAREFIEQIFGDVVWIESGDPTCEVMAQWMAERIYSSFEPINHVNVSVNETEKYGIDSSYGEYDELEELKKETDGGVTTLADRMEDEDDD